MTIGNLVALAVAFVATIGGAAGPASATASASRHVAPPVERPAIRHRFIPITAQRERETSAYGVRHYGRTGWTIARPHVIVEHLTENDSVDATFDIFAPDVPDIELHELPGLCSQFVIARSGAIYQFTPVTFMCRHTVGLNWTAIGIEHVAYREGDVFARRAQLDASLRLTRWLRCRYDVPVRDVIGHAESLSSSYHHERVASLRKQTHADWQPSAMGRYRALLRARGRC
ncbi:MAG TPA: N-acetylmuramoyl-L-alanine amidase [Conexibacter sp.]|nr:N-acetylmuramoyl-L-alanine amidase [Conexibacter sp.]